MIEQDNSEKGGQQEHGHHDNDHTGGGRGRPEHPDKLVTIEVNTKPVKIAGPTVTGLQIKEAAIAQGVDIKLDFVLSHEVGEGGRRTVIVGNDDVVTIHRGSKFHAVPPDDNSEGPTTRITEAVARAIEELKETFPDATVNVTPDGEGGAYVTVDPVPLSDVYQQVETWIGARITFQYPFCDVYPLYVREDLTRRDKAALGEAISTGVRFNERMAVQLSRRSKHWNAAVDTAALKFLKALSWLRSRP